MKMASLALGLACRSSGTYDESMFRIKICGITTVDDALDAVAAGADAIGLNFYSNSKRFVDREAARRIALSLPAGVTKVGVFVNSDVSEVSTTVEQIELDGIQLHGDEPPEMLAQLTRRVPVIRAARCGEQGLAGVEAYLAECGSRGRLPDAVLVDADAPWDYGGTGRLADWSLVARDRHLLGDLPLILAGGLTPTNVAAAIAAIRPDGVDVSSGVEVRPGRKDARLVGEFVAAARAALAR
jgi:phosphoribosylanthranilate isomerase